MRLLHLIRLKKVQLIFVCIPIDLIGKELLNDLFSRLEGFKIDLKLDTYLQLAGS